MSASVFPARGHDHGRCVARALAEAAAICTRHEARLTALRRRVLEIVWRSHRPLGAYAILDVLRSEGRTAAPPSVYRALDFLAAQGLVHRLASVNAFIGCPQPGHPGAGQFLICVECGTAAELDDDGVAAAIASSVAAQGFAAGSHTVEVHGLCPHCRPARSRGAGGSAR